MRGRFTTPSALRAVRSLVVVGLALGLGTGPRTVAAQPTASVEKAQPDYQFFGAASLGAIVVPYHTEWFPNLGIDALFRCRKAGFCRRYQLDFLRAHFDVSLSSNRWLENGYTRPPELHLPYVNFTLHAAELALPRRIRLAIGYVQLFRAPRFLFEDVNLAFTAARVRFDFLQVDRPRVQLGCWLDVGGPGAKYVRPAAYQAAQFVGLEVLRGQQGCQLVAGTPRLSGLFGYAVQSDLSVGQSGDGGPDLPGMFGAIRAESRLQLQLGLQIAGAQILPRADVSQIRLLGTMSVQGHIDRGCLFAGPEGALACSSNTLGFDYQLGIRLEFVFGAPSALRAKKGLSMPGLWPGFSL